MTDCNSLNASLTKVELTPRVHRWWSYMQTFDFDGMAHVDFLPRNLILKGNLKPINIVEKH